MVEGDFLCQTAQHLAQLFGQRLPVWAIDQTGEQFVKLFEFLVAEMDTDRNDPSTLQSAQMRQGEVPVGYGTGAKNGIAIVYDE